MVAEAIVGHLKTVKVKDFSLSVDISPSVEHTNLEVVPMNEYAADGERNSRNNGKTFEIEAGVYKLQQ